MFGVSFPELMLIGAVALIIVGPQRLPGMLGTLGTWSNKLRRMLFDVRQQSGIDDILRAEGISGGLKEIRDLRNAVRGNVSGLLTSGAAPPRQGVQQVLNQNKAPAPAPVAPTPEVGDPYADVPYDRTREYPDEGCDAYGAIPDDLWAASHPESKPTQSVVPKVPEPTEGSRAAVESSDAGTLPIAATLPIAQTTPVLGAALSAVAIAETIAAVTSESTTETTGANPAEAPQTTTAEEAVASAPETSPSSDSEDDSSSPETDTPAS